MKLNKIQFKRIQLNSIKMNKIRLNEIKMNKNKSSEHYIKVDKINFKLQSSVSKLIQSNSKNGTLYRNYARGKAELNKTPVIYLIGDKI